MRGSPYIGGSPNLPTRPDGPADAFGLRPIDGKGGFQLRQRLRSRLTHGKVAATLVSLAVILALEGVAIVALSGAEAAGQEQPRCGDTITTDTTLHRNLVNCPNNGIIIGADDVTLDLNYHRIDGDGAPAAGCDPETEFCDVGVLNRGHDGVTVVHGSVRQFGVDVFVLRASHNRLLGISSSVSSGSACCGLGFFRATRSLVRNSSGSGVAPLQGERPGDNGMFLIASHHVRVLHNSFRRNGDHGIFVRNSTHNLIKGNSLSDNHLGILVQLADRNRVRRNHSVGDGDGIVVDRGHRNVIARNRVLRAVIGGGAGIEIEGGRGNLFARNVVVGSDPEGLHVTAHARHMRLRHNRVRHSGDDGIDIDNRTAKLTRNEARRNGDLGIEAVPGVIDGGGNRASGNGDPRQCTNIACM